MEESVTQVAWLIEHTTVTVQPIGAGKEEEDHGQWMCTSLENVCVCMYINLLFVLVHLACIINICYSRPLSYLIDFFDSSSCVDCLRDDILFSVSKKYLDYFEYRD